ncbi:MAG: hypothetical protein OEW42_00790 [Acidimicrobiia bacterium]|nr:hypothetical protein [Acidimicrobiia bacterium]MDH5236882.1 hypothetical protein [Acidimicrobiia bacterium]
MNRDDESDLVGTALDLFVYAPLGLALEAREIIPKLAERGRGQVALARVVGRFALQRGQNEATKVVNAAVSGFRDVLTPDSADSGPETPAEPWPGYDHLTAAQIVKLLAQKPPAVVEAVAAHERAGRNRATVLNRVEQLRS